MVVASAAALVLAVCAWAAYLVFRPEPARAFGYCVSDDGRSVSVLVSYSEGSRVARAGVISANASNVDVGVWIDGGWPWRDRGSVAVVTSATIGLAEPLAGRAVRYFGQPLGALGAGAEGLLGCETVATP